MDQLLNRALAIVLLLYFGRKLLTETRPRVVTFPMEPRA